MKKITVYLQDNNPIRVEMDEKSFPISSFCLFTSVPQKDAGHFLAFGSSDEIGRMLFSFWRWSRKESEEMAYVLKEVSKDIIEEANLCSADDCKLLTGSFH